MNIDEKINKNLNKGIELAGAGLGTSAGSLGSALVINSFEISNEFLLVPFIGGVATTAVSAIPLTIAAGYAIKKFFD